VETIDAHKKRGRGFNIGPPGNFVRKDLTPSGKNHPLPWIFNPCAFYSKVRKIFTKKPRTPYFPPGFPTTVYLCTVWSRPPIPKKLFFLSADSGGMGKDQRPLVVGAIRYD
jgi:hypothetical protein